LPDEFGESSELRFRGVAPRGRQSVVATAGILIAAISPLVQLADPSVLQQSFQRRVEGAGMKLDLAGRALADLLHDAVAMAVLVGERDEHVKGRRLKRNTIEGCSVFHNRSNYICDRYTCQ
jgi:hypothetical protein